MDMLLEFIASTTGLGLEQLMAIVAFIAVVSQAIGKLIPDTATGVLGIVRKLAKILGLYVSNRVTPEVSVDTAAKTTAGVSP